MASWWLVLMAVPYEDVLILIRTASVPTTAVQRKPPTAAPDVQITGTKLARSSTSGSGSSSACLPDLLQSVPRLVPSGEDTPAAARGPAASATVPLRSQLSAGQGGPVTSEVVARCGAQLRRVAAELLNSRPTHTTARVWRRLELRLDLQHLLWASIAVHMAYAAVRGST